MIKKYLSGLTLFLVFAILVAPLTVFAIDYQNWVANTMRNVARPVWQLAAGLAVIMFIVAGILFITSNGEPGKITTAKQAVIWGIAGIVVATIAFGIVNFVSAWVQ